MCIVTENYNGVNEFAALFSFPAHILSGKALQGGENMRECDDPTVDLEDLIYEEEFLHSER